MYIFIIYIIIYYSMYIIYRILMNSSYIYMYLYKCMPYLLLCLQGSSCGSQRDHGGRAVRWFAIANGWILKWT